MKPSTSLPRVFVSGERVDPGAYRDLDSGATVVVKEPDELPECVRIVRTLRRFTRVDDEAAALDTLTLPPLLVEA